MLGSVFLEFGKGTSLGTNSHRFVIMFRLSTLLLQETCLSKKDLAPEYFEQKTNLYVLMKKKTGKFYDENNTSFSAIYCKNPASRMVGTRKYAPGARPGLSLGFRSWGASTRLKPGRSN